MATLENGKDLKDESSGEAGEDHEYELSNDIERSKIGIMRALVESRDPSSKNVDDYMLRRFLRARDLDTEKASNMFLKYLSWKRSFVPNGSISLSEIPNELAQNKVFLQGLDKEGRPIMVSYARRHFPSKSSTEELKRFLVFSVEKTCSRMPPGKEKFVLVVDLEGFGFENNDMRGFLAVLSILQDYYPERLAILYFVHVPYIFMALYKMASPFIDSNTKKKFCFVENKKLKSTLLSGIDESQLPVIYGGKLPLVTIQNS